MKQFIDFIPLILFFIVYKLEPRVIELAGHSVTLGGIFSATAVLILASVVVYGALLIHQRKLEKGHFKSQLLVQVHDELVLEVAAAEKDEIAALLQDTMEHVVDLSVPLTVDVHYGKNWEEAK